MKLRLIAGGRDFASRVRHRTWMGSVPSTAVVALGRGQYRPR